MRPLVLITMLALAACDDTVERLTSESHRATPPTPALSRTTPVAPEPDPDPVAPDPDPSDPDPDPDPIDPNPDPDPVDPNPDPDPTDPSPDPLDPGCEADLICIEAFPHIDRRDTTAGTSRFDRYSCAPTTNESGPELAYRLEVPEDGLLVATLQDLPAGVDVDLHLLADLDPDTCLERGHEALAAYVGAGSYYLVVDSWVSNSGAIKAGEFTLTLGLTRASDFESQGLDADVLALGLTAYAKAWKDRLTSRLEYTVIDFALHSVHPRLWTIDLSDGALLFVERVTHGEGSAAADPAWAERFSNVEGSHMSSLGLMKTARRYDSSLNGLSLRLDGLEPGFNDEVRSRAIVVHGDSYASPAFVATHGRMGLSWGCQVIDPAKIPAFIDTVEDGALMWTHFPDPAYLNGSTFLR